MLSFKAFLQSEDPSGVGIGRGKNEHVQKVLRDIYRGQSNVIPTIYTVRSGSVFEKSVP
jgi:hypothetical protein